MLTAHRKLHPTKIGKYINGWQIFSQEYIGGKISIVAEVQTKREAQNIVSMQYIPKQSCDNQSASASNSK